MFRTAGLLWILLAVLCLGNSTAEAAPIGLHTKNLTTYETMNEVKSPYGNCISNTSLICSDHVELRGFALLQQISDIKATSLVIERSAYFEDSRIFSEYLNSDLSIGLTYISVVSAVGERGTGVDLIQDSVMPSSTCRRQSVCDLGAETTVPIHSGCKFPEKSYYLLKLAAPAFAHQALNHRYAHAHYIAADMVADPKVPYGPAGSVSQKSRMQRALGQPLGHGNAHGGLGDAEHADGCLGDASRKLPGFGVLGRLRRKARGGRHPHISSRAWNKHMHSVHGNTPKFTTHFARAMVKELESYERSMRDDHRHVPQFLERIIELAETTLQSWNQEDGDDDAGWKEDAEGEWYFWWQPCEDQWACENVDGGRFWHTENTFVDWTDDDWKEYADVDGSEDDEEDAENGDDDE